MILNTNTHIQKGKFITKGKTIAKDIQKEMIIKNPWEEIQKDLSANNISGFTFTRNAQTTNKSKAWMLNNLTRHELYVRNQLSMDNYII